MCRVQQEPAGGVPRLEKAISAITNGIIFSYYNLKSFFFFYLFNIELKKLQRLQNLCGVACETRMDVCVYIEILNIRDKNNTADLVHEYYS